MICERIVNRWKNWILCNAVAITPARFPGPPRSRTGAGQTIVIVDEGRSTQFLTKNVVASVDFGNSVSLSERDGSFFRFEDSFGSSASPADSLPIRAELDAGGFSLSFFPFAANGTTFDLDLDFDVIGVDTPPAPSPEPITAVPEPPVPAPAPEAGYQDLVGQAPDGGTVFGSIDVDALVQDFVTNIDGFAIA